MPSLLLLKEPDRNFSTVQTRIKMLQAISNTKISAFFLRIKSQKNLKIKTFLIQLNILIQAI